MAGLLPLGISRFGFSTHSSATAMSTNTSVRTVLHRADSRGSANFGWLKSRHTFSFANYYHPERIHFGALRVLNDDIIAGGTGFGTHPHDNMEIVSIPLKGALAHKDSTGRAEVIRQGEVQIMSAGRGIRHSEMNHLKSEETHFLQIWILPKEMNIAPRYEQKPFAAEARQNSIQTVVAPDDAQAVWINQDAWFSLTTIDAGREVPYALHKAQQGVYVFVLSGKVEVAGETLGARDGLGVWDTDRIELRALEAAEVLLIEVPMLSVGE